MTHRFTVEMAARHSVPTITGYAAAKTSKSSIAGPNAAMSGCAVDGFGFRLSISETAEEFHRVAAERGSGGLLGATVLWHAYRAKVIRLFKRATRKGP